MKTNKRMFIIVIDSLGVGYDDSSEKYGDKGANTLKHIFESAQNDYQIPNLRKLGLCNLTDVKGNPKDSKPIAYFGKMHELSVGKDTMTGHWELMGVLTSAPFVTFTESGFPKELIDELEEKTGYKFIGNKAASGTEIIKELGERQMQTKEMIIYTSADSVLQIAANEEVFGLDEIYRVNQIAREITLKPEWYVGRVIARPFVGNSKDNFTRTSNRHDYAVDPTGHTVLDSLKENGYDVISIGKINDIFNTRGITKAIKSKSSIEGMDQTIEIAKEDFNGICFTNLVDFDAKWGHRRDPEGYAKELEDFDKKLGVLLSVLRDDDILMITADHGNDPTWSGSDHTREMVPILIYSKEFKESKELDDSDSFAAVGATIAEAFAIPNPPIGKSLLAYLK
ncbi:MAG: phosphopentomutase [Erysipelotrichaceae bacterium]|nr:phosphopentomutase [Erysipelotrichaceae bacterium]